MEDFGLTPHPSTHGRYPIHPAETDERWRVEPERKTHPK